jgi:hypothetical protein
MRIVISFLAIFFLCSCQSLGNEQVKNLNRELSDLNRNFCTDMAGCAIAIQQRRSIISRYSEVNLPTYEQFKITKLKGELDQLKFELRGFPKYCTSVADCKIRIEEGSQLLQNLPKPYENEYPKLREFALNDMQENLANLKKQNATYIYQQNLSKKGGVRLGMTPKQVVETTSWGKPNKINKTTNQFGTREQWVYGDGNYLYFTNGVLTSIQN